MTSTTTRELAQMVMDGYITRQDAAVAAGVTPNAISSAMHRIKFGLQPGTPRAPIPRGSGLPELPRIQSGDTAAIKAARAKGHTMQEIADACGVSRQRIHQVLNGRR